MRSFAPFWDSIPVDIKREILRIPFHDVERSIQEAKDEAAAYATKLANTERHKTHDTLVANKTNITASLHETRKSLTSLEKDIQECKLRVEALEVQECSAAAAIDASSRTHHSYTADVRAHPYPQHQPAAAPTMMAPPPPRPSAHAVHHTRPIQAAPVGRSDPPAT